MRKLLAVLGAVLVAGALVRLAIAPRSARWSRAELDCPGCSLLLVSIDTQRADHLGLYGYGRPTSPRLDALAHDAIVFERAYSTSYNTADSHMSMFTALYPTVHGVRNVWRKEPEPHPLSPRLRTLAELLRAGGWVTGAVTGGGNVGAIHGFDRGMDSYEVADDSTNVERALAFVDARDGARFFLFFHTFRVHDPYTPAPPWDTAFDPGYGGRIVSDLGAVARVGADDPFAAVRAAYWSRVDKDDPADVAHLGALYDGEIREVDAQVAGLIEAVRAVAPQTIVVLTADHGEQFKEHGGFLHGALYEELIHVPLVVWHPNLRAGGRVRERVSLVDLAPTLLEMLGVPRIEQFQGHSLLPLLAGQEGPRPVFSEKGGAGAALIVGDRKVIVTRRRGGERAELYDLDRDPSEHHDRARRKLAESGMRERLDAMRAANQARRTALVGEGDAPPGALDPRTVEQLKALGYLR
jgi:arylsulfatase A-like enzyme